MALFVDLTGKPCAKLVPVEAVEELQTEGVGFAGYAVGAMGQEPRDPDLVAIPDPASYMPVPFIRPGLAIVHCDPHVEALDPGHVHGSSHGTSRIVRRAYADPFHVRLTGRAFEAWQRAEDDTGETLLRTTGGLDTGAHRDSAGLAALTTPTEDFVLDRVGPVVVVSPCSGHGATFAALVGELAADLAMGAVGAEPRFALGRVGTMA
jgi:hypothetical protein